MDQRESNNRNNKNSNKNKRRKGIIEIVVVQGYIVIFVTNASLVSYRRIVMAVDTPAAASKDKGKAPESANTYEMPWYACARERSHVKTLES